MNKESIQNGTKSVTRTVTETSNGIGVGITTESGAITSDDGHVTPTNENGHVIEGSGGGLGVKADFSIGEVRSRLNSDAKVIFVKIMTIHHYHALPNHFRA